MEEEVKVRIGTELLPTEGGLSLLRQVHSLSQTGQMSSSSSSATELSNALCGAV